MNSVNLTPHQAQVYSLSERQTGGKLHTKAVIIYTSQVFVAMAKFITNVTANMHQV